MMKARQKGMHIRIEDPHITKIINRGYSGAAASQLKQKQEAPPRGYT